MTVYQWICVLGIPGMLAGLAAFVRLQGYATSDDRQNFENMYVQYHSLGENGVMDDVRQKFFALPME